LHDDILNIDGLNKRCGIMKKEFKIFILYFVYSFLWILFSDKILNAVIEERRLLIAIETYKGWIFISVTAIIFYKIIHNALEQLREKEDELKKKYEQAKDDNYKIRGLNQEIKETNKILEIQKTIYRKVIVKKN
jgi:cell shape-determining protein MreC